MTLRFHKMHGLGNDFVVIDGREASVAIDEAMARAMADRHRGIGCDQLILIENSLHADVAMRIFNADGSEVAACGNATRCVAQLVGGEATIATAAGLLHASRAGGGISVDMGEPRFGWEEIPLAFAMHSAGLPLAWEMLEKPWAINVGNPHVVFFVEDCDAVPLERLGPLIEHDPVFPERINVNVATVVDRGHLRLRVWERGAGLTRACGTGACATGVIAMMQGLVDSPVTVSLPGGDLSIGWAKGESIRMTGPATHVFSGEAELAAFRA